jgi:hypothetical protein
VVLSVVALEEVAVVAEPAAEVVAVAEVVGSSEVRTCAGPII